MNTVFGMVKVNIRHSRDAYINTGIVFALGVLNYILCVVIPGSDKNWTVSLGNYLYLVPVLAAIFVPAVNFTKLMHLGSKRIDFFKSCILIYVLAVFVSSLLCSILHKIIDPVILTHIEGIYDLSEVFGFAQNGEIIAFFQICAFLTLLCCTIHTLTLIQGRWYGWAADAIIIAIISIFTPIAKLRSVLVWFLNMIIYHDNAIVQICSCLILGAVIYCASFIPIRSKQI